MTEPDAPGVQLDPQLVINRLIQRLAEAELRAAKLGALADQLLAERAVGFGGEASVGP